MTTPEPASLARWLEGVAELLAAEVPGLAWSPDAPYPPGTVGLHLEGSPSSVECVVLTGYEGARPEIGYDTPRLQVRTRSASREASRARCQAIYDALHELGTRQLPGGVWVQDVQARASAPAYLGPDEAGLHEHVGNFDIDLPNPARQQRSA